MLAKKVEYRIIIFGNEEDFIQNLALELEIMGLHSVTVPCYQTLLLEIEKQKYYIVLAEYLMPTINGNELIEKLHKDIGAVPPIVFLLRDHDKSIMKGLHQTGIQDYILLNDETKYSIAERMRFIVGKINIQKALINNETDTYGFYQLLDSINDFVVITDLNENLVFVNQSYLSKTMFTRAEVMKMKSTEIIAPQNLYDFMLEMRLLKEQKKHLFETSLISKDYQITPVEISSSFMRINKEELIINIARDISDRKNTKEQLKKLNLDLEKINAEYKIQNERLRAINREVEENRHALKLALQAAENSEQLKNRFLANMSHEIRTPMNAIVGFSQLLEDADLNEIPSFVRIINANSETLLQLINDLMDIAKIESDLVAIKTEELSVHELLLDIETIYKYEKKNKGKRHIFINYKQNSGKDCVIETDKLRLKQVLMNLMSNALKFTEEGTIEFGFSQEKDYVDIFVKDTGIGIPQKMQHQIFERFRQLDDEEKPQGTGIGLSISRSLMRLLGGDIKLEADTSKGSVFHLHHPLSQKKNKRVKPAQKNMVLIAEDDEDNFHLLKYIVKDLNLDVIWAKNGQEAIDFCSRKPVSLILMDIKMPSVGGLDATREILKQKPNIPIIAQTAYTQDEDKRRCKEAGCVDFIPKPINLTTLRRTIAKYI